MMEAPAAVILENTRMAPMPHQHAVWGKVKFGNFPKPCHINARSVKVTLPRLQEGKRKLSKKSPFGPDKAHRFGPRRVEEALHVKLDAAD